MNGTESPDFDRLAEMREVLREAREDRAEIARLRREKEILAIAIQLAIREKAELVAALRIARDWMPVTPFDEDARDDVAIVDAAMRSATETKEPPHGK